MTIIDLSYLNTITDGDMDLNKELISVFKIQIPEFIQDFKTAIQNKDVIAFGEIAHKAKSSVQIFGMEELYLKLNETEDTIQKTNPAFNNRFIELFEYFQQQTVIALNELNAITDLSNP